MFYYTFKEELCWKGWQITSGLDCSIITVSVKFYDMGGYGLN